MCERCPICEKIIECGAVAHGFSMEEIHGYKNEDDIPEGMQCNECS